MIIAVVLLILAIVLFALGTIDRYTGNNRALPIAFFVLAFLHLLGAIFVFTGGVAPYGSVQTVNTTYQPGYFEYANDSVSCLDCGNCTNTTIANITSSCCEHDVNTTVTGTITQEYAYNTYGADLMLAYFVVDGILFFLLFFVYLLSLLASYFRIITGKRREEDDD